MGAGNKLQPNPRLKQWFLESMWTFSDWWMIKQKGWNQGKKNEIRKNGDNESKNETEPWKGKQEIKNKGKFNGSLLWYHVRVRIHEQEMMNWQRGTSLILVTVYYDIVSIQGCSNIYTKGEANRDEKQNRWAGKTNITNC